MKIRVKKKGNLFYPQYKSLFFWFNICSFYGEGTRGDFVPDCTTNLSEAVKIALEHNQIVSNTKAKIPKRSIFGNVVWTSEDGNNGKYL